MRLFARSEEAATITEFALLLPVLMMLLLGVIEGGRVLSTWVVLTNETREAARWGIAGVRDASDASLTSDITTHLTQRVNAILNCSPLTVTPTLTSLDSGEPATVTVDAKCTVNTLDAFMQALIGSPTVDAKSTMRAE